MPDNTAVALKWHLDVQGVKLNEAGDEFIYLYDENAVEQAIYLAIRYSEHSNRLINCHPGEVRFLLNELTEELESKELALELGSIRLNYNYLTKTLEFEGMPNLNSRLPIQLALELTDGDL